ncbi:MAG: rhamnan synthesis F family protein [Silicimonas sp.]|nr:rhamnan synthesis F family protein [Silicimonas sp.]
MIPGWKLRREFERLRTQIAALPSLVVQPFVQRRYDRRRATAIRVSEGALAAGPKLAIFLIYQPKGVSAGVLATCDHLLARGFAPIVISNTPLSREDQTALQPRAHLLVERPNYGYDFGGYRDGVWLINSRGLAPESVLFLNDSVWFPIFGDSDMLTRMETAPENYLGTQVFGDVTAQGRKQGFLGSYCFLIKAPVWQSETFQRFWAEYRNSSNKEVTLRRGERAFSRLILSACGGGAALFDQARFAAMVEGLTEAELREAIGDMVVTDPALEAEQTAMLARLDSAGADEMRALIHVSARSKNYIAAAPVLSLRKLGFPMIKKNNERHYKFARQRILRAVEEGRLPGLDPVTLAELRARD